MKPGLIAVAVFLLLSLGRGASAQISLDLLEPPDTSSPRATLQAFISAAGEAGAVLLSAYEEREAAARLFASGAVKLKVARAERLLDRAARTLDLSALPEIEIANAKVETVLQLKQILERVPLPDPSTIPDAAAIAKAQGDGSDPLPGWRIPGTDIRIVRIADGPRAGEYLFSADSVAQVEGFFDLVRDLPARSGSVDLYDFFGQAPGHLLPPAWFEHVRRGPSWLMHRYLDQAAWQWAGLAALVLAACGTIAILLAALRRRPVGASRAARIVHRLAVPVAIVAAASLLLAGVDALTFRGGVLTVLEMGSAVAQALAIAWASVLICNGLAQFVVESPDVVPGSLDAHFMRAGFRVAGIVAAAGIVGYAATQLGIPLIGVLAGLGVGGLAIALAAQPTIENFIGGVILYTDRPVRKGDWCQFGEMNGVVEEIGIRSTRIRALDGSLVTVPNADFARESLVNYSACETMLFEASLPMRRETPPAALRRFVDGVRRLLDAHPKILKDDLNVHLAAIGASSLDVSVEAYVDTADWDEFDAISEELLFAILDIAEASRVAFAMPSQTTYLAPDTGEAGKRWNAVRTALAEMKAAPAAG